MEFWREIPESCGRYEVSNYGRIRKWTNQRGTPITTPKILKPYSGHGRGRRQHTTYCRTHLTLGGRVRSLLVHRLVALAFIPNPNNYPFVNHKDGDGLNNVVDNLEWCNHSMNFRHALLKFPNKNSKLDAPKRAEARKLLKDGLPQKEVVRIMGVDPSQISRLKSGEQWGYE